MKQNSFRKFKFVSRSRANFIFTSNCVHFPVVKKISAAFWLIAKIPAGFRLAQSFPGSAANGGGLGSG